MKKKPMSIRFIATCAVLAAMYFALSFVSIKLGSMKISVSGLPVLVSAALLGPLAGFLTGLVGAFLEQLVSYGLTATTLLWILPVAVRGLIVGLYAKNKSYALSRRQLMLISVLSALALTALNTAVMYIDSVLYGYYSYAYVFGAVLPRIGIGVLTGIVFALILPPLLKLLRKDSWH